MCCAAALSEGAVDCGRAGLSRGKLCDPRNAREAVGDLRNSPLHGPIRHGGGVERETGLAFEDLTRM